MFTVIDDNGGTTGGTGHADAAIPAADGCAAAIHAADDGGTKQGMKGRRHRGKKEGRGKQNVYL